MFSDFNKVFHPEKRWMHKSLIKERPCDYCKVQKEYINNRYLYMMSEGSDREIVEKCKHCIKHITWTMDCIQKLKWYEENDERLKHENE